MSFSTLALLAASFLTVTPGSSPAGWASDGLTGRLPGGGSQETTPSGRGHSTAQESAIEVAPLLRRVRLIGASVTAGYGTAAQSDLRRNLPLEIFLECALAPKNAGANLDTSGSNMFFQAPTLTGKRQVSWAVQADPTLVVALDFLFWYGFGVNTKQEPRRIAGLEKGLKELEAIDCPLIIGTLPNVDHAMQGEGPFGRPILSWSQIPDDASRKKMNERILEWASGRENVVVIDSSSNLADFVAGEELKLGDEVWKPESMTRVLQKDLLHLSVDGYVWTALTIADAVARLEGASPVDFKRRREDVRDTFDAHVKSEIARRASRRKRSTSKSGDS